MKSYREARERVVAMDHECLEKLGRSDITIQNFVAPTTGLLYPIETLVVAATFLSYSQRWWFEPGGSVAGVLGQGFARFSWVIQPWLLLGMIAIHGGEALWFERTRLRVHSVNPRTVVWWLWMGFCFLEGWFFFFFSPLLHLPLLLSCLERDLQFCECDWADSSSTLRSICLHEVQGSRREEASGEGEAEALRARP